MQFPRIQGIDVCGCIVAVGSGVNSSRMGELVLVDPCLREPVQWESFQAHFLGSECNGGFAQYCVAPAIHTHKIECPLTDVELASFPCAYSTAENLLHRMKLAAGETVLVTGASGGVGSAAVQLAKRRGAKVIAVAAEEKGASVVALGAERVVPRGENLVEALGRECLEAVVDLVAGPQWPELLGLLKPGGRYATAGAIAGPIVPLAKINSNSRPISPSAHRTFCVLAEVGRPHIVNMFALLLRSRHPPSITWRPHRI